jgi:hypothetical protein
MNKQLLFTCPRLLTRKMTLRMLAAAVFMLFTAQSNFAQTNYTWTGAVSTTFEDINNWSSTGTPTFASTSENFLIPFVSGKDLITNATAITCRTITLGTGVTLTANANITSTSNTSSVNGTFNINSATVNMPKLYIGTVAGGSGVVNIESGAILTANSVWRVGNFAGSPGTININGGTVTMSGSGVLSNSSLTLGNLSSGTLNINAGIININYTDFGTGFVITSNGHINIDAGSMVIPGDKTTAIQAFIDAGKITVSGAALTAGKTISNAYDAVTDKTTVIASGGLGVKDVTDNADVIVVYSQSQGIMIQSGNSMLSDVKVYDLRGSLVGSKNNDGSDQTSIALNKSNQVYIVKVTSTDGAVVTKKIIH